MKRILVAACAAWLTFSDPIEGCSAAGNPSRGQQVFRACAACHSLEPDRNMTGPSLGKLWNRKAGDLASFRRYSPALKSSGVIWNDQTLDQWIRDPEHLIPGNTMTFAGIKDAQQRADLLTFLKTAMESGRREAQSQPGGGQTGGMAGMMGGGSAPNLKKLESGDRVKTISYCGDSYRVTTINGKSRDFWERNLRFKTDSSDEGPDKGAPAIVEAGMMGDRASVIFATPDEISTWIKREC